MPPTSSNVIPLPSASAQTAPSFSPAAADLEDAIARAQQNLLRQQHPDGHWCGELLVDSTLCSDYVLFMHWLGEVDEELQQRCVRHILKRQLPDHGWNIYYGGPSEVNASVKAYFALKLAGHSADLPFMQEARANILRLGGIPRMNTYSKLYLALLGQFPWHYLPSIPVEMICFRNGRHSTSTRCHRGAGRCSSAGDHQSLSSRHENCRRRSNLPRALSSRHGAERLYAAASSPLLCVAKFLPPLRSCAQADLEGRLAADAETRAREAERWMLERIGEGSDWPRGGLPGNAECTDRVARSWLSGHASCVQKSAR
jgi:squalene cyclase